jgi:hypothetical protein
MTKQHAFDLREALIDAHTHFFFLQAKGPQRLRLLEIHEDALVVDLPTGAPMRKTVLGLIPTLDGHGVYEIEGTVQRDREPSQPSDTVSIAVGANGVRKLNRRQYPRAHFAPPVLASVTAKGHDAPFAARVINLSGGGLRAEVDRELSAEKVYIFRFEIECDDEIHAIIRDTKIIYELPMEGGFSYGFKFLGKPAKKREGKKEAPLAEIEQTVDLLYLVNRLLIWK